MDIKDLRQNEGLEIEVLGERFKLDIMRDSGGEWAVWTSNKYFVYATLNFECEGVPAELHTINGDDVDFTEISCNFQGTVNTFNQYVSVCRFLIEYMILEYKAKKMQEYQDERHHYAGGLFT